MVAAAGNRGGVLLFGMYWMHVFPAPEERGPLAFAKNHGEQKSYGILQQFSLPLNNNPLQPKIRHHSNIYQTH